MIQFFSPDIAVNPVLPESDSQHCVRVLRLREGDDIQIVDGKGFVYQCRIVDAHPKRTMVEILSSDEHPLPWQQQITIAVAPTKHIDRMEWLVEKLVEVGVNRIIPLRCRFSERKEIKVERLQKIAVSAMKQSLKAVLPQISPLTPIEEVIASQQPGQKFIAYCSELYPRMQLARVYQPHSDAIVLIGPEGDFSDTEISSAVEAGYLPVTLGDNRLRTETAALYCCTAFHVLSTASDS